MPLVRVRGRSMVPALRPGDFIWVCRTKTLRRGRIVMIKKEDDGAYLKRIIGLPNELIEIRAGRVFINGKRLDEPYVPESAYLEPKPDQTIKLPESSFFVLGDARDDSLDSRSFGPVRPDDVIGVAVCRIWPPKLSL